MPAITSFEPTLRDAAPVIHSRACERCGAPVEPLDRYCNSCGGEQPLSAEVHRPQPESRHLRCENCGAEVAIDLEHRSYICAFCDSKYVVEFTPAETGRQPPEFVIGFSITPEQALERFRGWLAGNRWFRPSDLLRAQIEDRLRGVYLPFWAFAMLAESDWSASIGEHWYRTETYTTTENGKTVTKTRTVTETEWWQLNGRHHRFYSGFLVSGSRGLAQADAERIKPFHLAALKRYEPYFLAGWLSEEYSIERQQAQEFCQQEFCQRELEAVGRFLPGDTYSGLSVQTQFSRVSSDLILLPVYLISYRYRDRVYRFLLNGQTGKADGDKPVSWRKILAAVFTFVIVVVMLFLLLSQL